MTIDTRMHDWRITTSGDWEMNREWLIPLLACPDCGNPLDYKGHTHEPAALDGFLTCTHCGGFPVISGIPRLLPARYLYVYLAKYYPETLNLIHAQRRFQNLDKISEEQEVVIRTMYSFGYQWNSFSEDHMVWQKEYDRCMGPLQPEHLDTGRIVADIGCGMGRMIYRASQAKARFVGLDLSNAIESAAELCKGRTNVALIQGDILHPPYKDNTFDTIYSVGVLHHLPGGVSKGLSRLIPLLKQGGFLHTWFYGSQRGDDNKSPVMLIRSVIKKLPLKLIFIFAYILAAFILFFINYPAILLSRIPKLQIHFPEIPIPLLESNELQSNSLQCF